MSQSLADHLKENLVQLNSELEAVREKAKQQNKYSMTNKNRIELLTQDLEFVKRRVVGPQDKSDAKPKQRKMPSASPTVVAYLQ